MLFVLKRTTRHYRLNRWTSAIPLINSFSQLRLQENGSQMKIYSSSRHISLVVHGEIYDEAAAAEERRARFLAEGWKNYAIPACCKMIIDTKITKTTINLIYDCWNLSAVGRGRRCPLTVFLSSKSVCVCVLPIKARRFIFAQLITDGFEWKISEMTLTHREAELLLEFLVVDDLNESLAAGWQQRHHQHMRHVE